jgi:hypothetical protein
MNELSPEVQAAIIMSASHAAIEFAEIKLEGKKGKKSFTRLYAEAFEKNYNALCGMIIKPEVGSTAL